LIVLLGILAIVLGAFLVDLFYMFDAVNAAAVRLQTAADEMAKRPSEKGKSQFLTQEGVVAAIGFAPTNSKVESGKLIEQYRWWGALPLERRYIQVFYSDAEGTNYDSFSINNRDIYGNDNDPEAGAAGNQAPVDPSAVPASPMLPGAKSPPVPEPNPQPAEASGDSGDSETPPKDEGSPGTPSDAPPSDNTSDAKLDSEDSSEK
jgi:hypothetical protein